MRPSSFAASAAVVLALLPVVSSAAAAQSCTAFGSITGTVRSDAGAPIPRVQLSAPGGVTALSDSVGHYRLARVCAGRIELEARRLGFRARSYAAEVDAGQTAHLDLVMDVVPLEMDPVVVAARPSPMAMRMREFYQRRQQNPGYFFSREDLKPYDERPLSDVLRARVPGAQVATTGGDTRVRLRGQRCAPMVWLDGMSTPAAEFDIDVIETSGVAAMEVYSGIATIPAQFRTPFGRDGCGGAIVIWTRVGPDQWDAPRPSKAKAREHTTVAQLPIYHPEEVDVQARIDSTAIVHPVYPDSLLAFGVEGAVTVEFVVDTSGRPLTGTVKVVSASAPGFGSSVIHAITSSRFFPARKGDQPVRQLMTLPFRFTTRPE